MTKYFYKIYNFISSFFDFKKFYSIIYFPLFLMDLFKYKFYLKSKEKTFDLIPCLADRVSVTPFDPHYLYQAAWLSRHLANGSFSSPHVDVSSDVKLIAILSAFIPIEFVDFRPIDPGLSNLACTEGDILDLPFPDNSLKSISSLHVIEHIGLGRYGDPLNPMGSFSALKELSRVLSPGGKLYITVPVGEERVCFNAHRVFDPFTIVNGLSKLKLLSFSLVDDSKFFIENTTDFIYANKQQYGCGMFVFTK